MDILSIVGVIVGIGAVLLGIVLDGGEISSLFNAPAMIIVFGGTLGATLLQFPTTVFIKSIKMFGWILLPKNVNLKLQINKIIKWSVLARKEGLLGLENEMPREKDPFSQKGLQLLVDGNEPEVIRDTLELELDSREHSDLQAARMYEAMGGYAPTIGILGAVMGLIHVMQNLTNPELLGQGIATAFVATIYGVGSANLIFLPVANKLKTHIFTISQARELMVEGIICIAEGENPRNIELKLNGYMHDKK
ncbi:MAG: flagellar motor protein [Methylococcaceae bacterium]|nr:flagellar motor protein [Methylococcaceae bacterium]MDZ4158067.1 flagellar motor protein [Methylococcales bacterium]MDP2392858.1 flagellar motor protein [Methylococcaceae bacterium]MDP3020386.1 flagellar motor protein [Methylococcaceae bacterium]MDP3391993.1 flagellar motor protein [Methylococcaceae bacterium]